MLNRRSLLCLQILCFAAVSLFALLIAYYFPNLPPLLRPLKGLIVMKSDAGPDTRFMEWFNRDPERTIPLDNNVIISPADGFIQLITSFRDMQHIVIEMRYTDVHIQRVPIEGTVLSIEGEGRKLSGNVRIGEYMLDKMMPYQKLTTLDTEIGIVRVRQITSYFASRIQVFLKEKERVQRGQRLGRILAGSTIVVELPETVEILVRKNQDVRGGETIIARY